MRFRPVRWAFWGVVLAAGCGCSAASGSVASAAEFDRPVAPGVARGELSVRVDLEPAQDCEERFDLALYADRSIDLISWDDQVGSCVGRVVKVRFLSESANRQQVMQRIQGLVRSAKEVADEAREARGEDNS